MDDFVKKYIALTDKLDNEFPDYGHVVVARKLGKPVEITVHLKDDDLKTEIEPIVQKFAKEIDVSAVTFQPFAKGRII